jgi:ribonuclease P protein component
MSLHARVRSDGLPARTTVVAGRKVGGAVARNRAKRRLRAVLSEAGERMRLPDGLDVVLVAKEAAVHARYEDLTEDFAAARRRLLERLEPRP